MTKLLTKSAMLIGQLGQSDSDQVAIAAMIECIRHNMDDELVMLKR